MKGVKTISNMARKSNLEILRIICIFGILLMHTFAEFCATCSGGSLIFGLLLSSIFNMGVSCFMLISGYFGVKFSAEKVIKLELTILFYSLLGQVISIIIKGNVDIKALFKSIFPVATGKYWYMSAYMVIIFVSPYIEKLLESLDRKAFRLFLLTLLFFFYIMPTFTFYEIMNDTGKGVVNMFIVYLTGRYIKKYHDDKMKPQKLITIGSIIIGCTFIIDYILSILRGGVGIFAPFSRDNSITIYLGSIFFFLAFKNMRDIQSSAINKFAGSVFAMYLFEEPMERILGQFYSVGFSAYGDKWYLFAICAFYVLIVMISIFIIDTIKKILLEKSENKLTNVITKLLFKFKDKLGKQINI